MLNTAILRNHFNYIVGYTERNFSPHAATSLSMKLCHKLFVECFSMTRSLPELLKEEEGLGAHTGVVLLSQLFGVRYFWCHRSIRPLGEKVSLQCAQCRAIKTLSFLSTGLAGKFKVRCRCRFDCEHLVNHKGVLFPEGGIGWGRAFIYGSEKEYQDVRNAPRSTYDTL